MTKETKLQPIEPLFVPTVHLNGTSREALLADLIGAINAVVAAKEALRQTHPHGRDYYPQAADPKQWATRGNPTEGAIRQFGRREAALEAVREELTLIAMAVQDQVK